MTDRIKLAEAMGWKLASPKQWIGEDPGEVWKSPDGKYSMVPPDPFTDANDDYAVLEWARQSAADECGLLPSGKPRWSSSDKWWPFYETLNAKPHRVEMYQIGDYARAALKVIK